MTLIRWFVAREAWESTALQRDAEHAAVERVTCQFATLRGAAMESAELARSFDGVARQRAIVSAFRSHDARPPYNVLMRGA